MIKKLIKSVVGESIFNKLKEIKHKLVHGKQDRLQEQLEKEKRSKFYAQFLKKGDLCFDVGANIGNRIEPLLTIGAKVVAVEPQEQCYKVLESKFGDTITIVKLGLGAREEVRQFYISDASTISSFAEDWISSVKETRFKDQEWNKVENIQLTTLDNLISQYGLPAFIKIDVEGFEIEVLKGLSKPVRVISYEYTVPEQTGKALACLERIYAINNQIEVNYSVGESMDWALPQWVSYEEMHAHIQTNEFAGTQFGDIYVRSTHQG